MKEDPWESLLGGILKVPRMAAVSAGGARRCRPLCACWAR